MFVIEKNPALRLANIFLAIKPVELHVLLATMFYNMRLITWFAKHALKIA